MPLRAAAAEQGKGQPRLEHELALEMLVSATELGRRLHRLLRTPYDRACALCAEAIAVAELAARLDLTVGTTRALVGELIDDQLVEAHPPIGGYPPQARRDALDRVFSRLHDL
ncbi:hypothetical protein GCM10022222_30160 [Amycolatopsis ultiminotia]|uniref:DUF742 domain-containing protein n=1 Tax=Amycolatopsis ultiminotia TaxID=543629 RepID=A0ABP6W3R8_9PSEU